MIKISIWWHAPTHNYRAKYWISTTNLDCKYSSTRTRTTHQQWALVKSSKCHKQGQYKIMTHHPLVKTNIYIPADAVHPACVGLLLRILSHHWGMMTSTYRVKCSIPLMYSLSLYACIDVAWLSNTLFSLCTLCYSLFYCVLSCFDYNVYPGYGFYCVWA